MSSEELNANQLNISLKLDDCKMDDAGEITAIAQNAAGEDACSAILKIKSTLTLIMIINTWIKILVTLFFSYSDLEDQKSVMVHFVFHFGREMFFNSAVCQRKKTDSMQLKMIYVKFFIYIRKNITRSGLFHHY